MGLFFFTFFLTIAHTWLLQIAKKIKNKILKAGHSVRPINLHRLTLTSFSTHYFPKTFGEKIQPEWNMSFVVFFLIHLLVALEHRRRDEGLLAQVALVLLVAVVHHLDVYVEGVLPLEGGVALVALERPLTWGMER